MKKLIVVALTIYPLAISFAQTLAPEPGSSPSSNSTPAAAADVEALRQQVQSLTETVKALQQQVKDQQSALQKANLAAESPPQNPEPSPAPAAASAPPRFPTEDTSVVASG